MNRRKFLAMLSGAALSPAIPFGRVWSFPTNIVIAHPPTGLLQIWNGLEFESIARVTDIQTWGGHAIDLDIWDETVKIIGNKIKEPWPESNPL